MSLNTASAADSEINTTHIPLDAHVHIMSPRLIKLWKNKGIEFSKENNFYSDINTIVKNNGSTRIHLISMAYVYSNTQLSSTKKLYTQVKEENNFVFHAANERENVDAFCSVDPLQNYAKQEITRCFQRLNIRGIKLHFNASQVYLTEKSHRKKLRQIFEQIAQNGMSVLLHFDNTHPKFGERDAYLLFNELLKDLPPIQLTIAHFGTSGGFNDKTQRVVDGLLRLINKTELGAGHTILFDISAVALDKTSEGVQSLTDDQWPLLKRYIEKIGTEHIVFGSDYPLYTASEYATILKNKVGLSEDQLQSILQPK